MQEKQTFFKW